MSRQIPIALLFLFAWSSAPAAEGNDMERASNACAMGTLALDFVAEKLAYDVDAVDSDQGREAFLGELEGLDKRYHEMPTFKVIWLLSLSDALSELRHELTIVAQAAQGPNVSAARVKQLRASEWTSAANELAEVCMFRAGKLVGQGKLGPG